MRIEFRTVSNRLAPHDSVAGNQPRRLPVEGQSGHVGGVGDDGLRIARSSIRFRTRPCERNRTFPSKTSHPASSARARRYSPRAAATFREVPNVGLPSVSRGKRIASKRTVGDRSGRKPLVDLIDLILRQDCATTSGLNASRSVSLSGIVRSADVSCRSRVEQTGSAAATPRCGTPQSSTQLWWAGRIVEACGVFIGPSRSHCIVQADRDAQMRRYTPPSAAAAAPAASD